MRCSMCRKGNCWDNAPTASWFHSFKNERYHGIKYQTYEEMKDESFEYIEVFYNCTCLHSTLGYLSPTAYLHHWLQQQNPPQRAAKARAYGELNCERRSACDSLTFAFNYITAI